MFLSESSYATVYTMAPVFSLVLDEDVSADIALTYPELYQELMKVELPKIPAHFQVRFLVGPSFTLREDQSP